ncbi:hypothetical protein C8Q80DRAFT_508406 [Daedaleopsis nitida]|nr:hypothetical protein C8Q80DRAFT_508406 [Daedaleopsis nitida]
MSFPRDHIDLPRDLLERDRARSGENECLVLISTLWRSRPSIPILQHKSETCLDHDLRSALSQILDGHPRDRTVAVRDEHLVALRRRAPEPEIEREALASYVLPQHGVRQPALLEIALRGQVRLHDLRDAVAGERERGVVDVFDAGPLRGVDRVLVLRGGQFRCDGGVGDDEELVGAREGGVEGRGVAVVAAADLGARLFNRGGCACWVVERHYDVGGYKPSGVNSDVEEYREAFNCTGFELDEVFEHLGPEAASCPRHHYVLRHVAMAQGLAGRRCVCSLR